MPIIGSDVCELREREIPARCASLSKPRSSDEALLRPRRLLARPPYRAGRESACRTPPRRSTCASTRLEDGTDFYSINPEGLRAAARARRRQGVAFGSRRDPAVHRRPQAGHARTRLRWLERYKLMEWLTFVGSEVHKDVRPAVVPDHAGSHEEASKEKLASRFEPLEKTLAAQPFLTGRTFTIADAYLFTVTRWAHAPQGRSLGVSGAGRLHGARGSASRRAEGAGRRRPEVTLAMSAAAPARTRAGVQPLERTIP